MVTIEKSPNDKNEYRYIKLENELEVVLVSDPITDFSSCTLVVGIGSLSNPESIPGLAHFLEHMLFLGTEKYPNEDEFIEFMSKNSGLYNATTGSTKTTYYYKIPEPLLKESMDRFSSFFISPLLKENSVDRELNAVDSEHVNNKQNDDWRIDRIKYDQFEGHPVSKFSTGNSDTLKIDGIRDKVAEFYNQYYSSNIMKLAVYGKESLDQLEQFVREYFSPIKNKNAVIPTFDPLPLKQSIWLECESNTEDILKITFPITDTSIDFQDYKDQSSTVFSNILGHEANGSLFSLLQEKNYAIGLSFGCFSTTPTINQMEFTIHLTPSGIENVDEIIGLTFQYCDNVQFPKYFYDERKLISSVNWSKFQKSDPISVTSAIASHLFKVKSPADVLKYCHFWNEYAPETIEKMRSYIRPDNMIALLYIKDIKQDENTLTEKYYNMKYNKRMVTQDDIKRWRSVSKSDKLYAPLPNPFIPSDFSIKAPQDQSVHLPETVYQEKGITIYHSMDHRFNTPKARVFIKFETPFFGNTYYITLCNFLKKSLKVGLNEKILYNLYLLDYELKITNYVPHLELLAGGYSEKIFLALEEVFKYYYSFDITDSQFETIKEKVTTRTGLILNSPPYLLSSTETNLYTLNSNGSNTEKLEIIESITKQDFISFVRQYFSYLNLSILIVGNATKEEAQSFGKTLNSFHRTPLSSSDAFECLRVRLPRGIETHLKKEIFDKNQTNCVGSILLLLGEFTLKNRAIQFALYQMMYDVYYDELRTKQQFGYVVSVACDSNAHSLGLRFYLQSHSKTPEDIYRATDKFFYDFTQVLDKLENEPDTFKLIIQSLQKSLLGKTYNNRSQSQIYWNSHLIKPGVFDMEVRTSNALGELTFQDVKQAYNDYILPSSPNRRVFVVNLYPASMKFDLTNSIKEKDNIIVVGDGSHTEFRRKYGYFPGCNFN